MVQQPVIQPAAIEKLRPSPFNPRKDFPKDELAELADSIRAQGVIDPLVVREVSAGGAWHLEIIDGERRFRAAQLAQLPSVPVIVREASDEQAREHQLTTFLQRKGLPPLAEAQALQNLLKTVNSHAPAAKPGGEAVPEKIGVREIAARVGKSERYVYARLELLTLATPVKRALAAGKIEASVAQELVPLKTEQQLDALEMTQDEYEPLRTVQDVRDYIAVQFREKPKPPKLTAKEKAARAAEAKRRTAQDARWKAQAAKDERERKINELAMERVETAIWPKLKALPAAKLTEAAIADVLADGYTVREAAKIAGKRASRLALAAYVGFRNDFRYFDKPGWSWALAKACGIDPAKVRQAAAAELAPKKPAPQASAKRAQAAAKAPKARAVKRSRAKGKSTVRKAR